MTADGPRRTAANPLRIWDISPAVDERAEVFPGDTPYSQQLHFSLSPDCPVNVNRITLSPHTGAHADAPLHYAAGAAAIGELDLAPYLGPCRVIHCIDCGPMVLPHHIAHALDGLPGRVLLRTTRSALSCWRRCRPHLRRPPCTTKRCACWHGAACRCPPATPGATGRRAMSRATRLK